MADVPAAQQQPLTAQQQAAIAQQFGLPPDAPLGAIDAFLRACQVDKGKGKGKSATSELKKQAEAAVIQYMKDRNLQFLQIQDKFLVYKSEAKVEGWSDELVLKAYIAFHQRNLHQGPLEQVAMKFLEFCKTARRTDVSHDVLSVQKKRPMSATLEMLARMGTL